MNFIPQLSADGQKVAFVATAHYIPSGEESSATEGATDLYVADMAPGLTRVQALRRVTAVSGGDSARGGAIDDFTISPDGTQVAFSSARTVFDLGTLSLVSPPETEALAQQLYEGDLSNGTLTHVTSATKASAPKHAAKTTSRRRLRTSPTTTRCSPSPPRCSTSSTGTATAPTTRSRSKK